MEAKRPRPRVPRVGYLGNGDARGASDERTAFLEGLRALGWVPDRSIALEYRWAEGKPERLPSLAAELVRVKCDVIVVSGSAAVKAAQEATRDVPIVIAALLVDPVKAGFVASLARPGGNTTGLASQYEEIVTKQMQLLAEAFPDLSKVGVLQDCSGGVSHEVGQATAESTAAAAEWLGLWTTRIGSIALSPRRGARALRRSMCFRARFSTCIAVASSVSLPDTACPPSTS